MTSLQTNIAARTALQALNATNAELAKTQNQISSGYRVASASDNAAYWSIATTMRSDNKALSAVRDSLGLGSALVDTAYQGLSTSAELISEFKSKLALTKTEGVDRKKVQAELDQLKSLIQSVASSSTFAGVNWLSTNHGENLKQTDGFSADIVSSAFRSENGFDLNTIGVKLNDISLINSGGGGILQKDPDYFKDLGGFLNINSYVVGHDGHDKYRFTGPATITSFDAIAFDINVDSSPYSSGITTSVLIDRATIDSALGPGAGGSISTSDEWKEVLEYAFVSHGITASISAPNHEGGDINIRSAGSWAYGSSITISNINSTLPSGFAFGLEDGPYVEHDNIYPRIKFDFTTPFEIPDDGAIYFDSTPYYKPDYAVSTPLPFRITRHDVNVILDRKDGIIGSAHELAFVLTRLNETFTATATGDTIELFLEPTMYAAYGKDATPFYVGNVRTSQEYALRFSLDDVDITSPDADIDEYIVGVDHMEKTIIMAASRLGAVQNRIAIQTDFLDKLMDTIDRGIGTLVDADMTEASTRLKALQTQQQLGVQALSIANSSSQSLLSLFE